MAIIIKLKKYIGFVTYSITKSIRGTLTLKQTWNGKVIRKVVTTLF